jgi:hypothetical protein
VGAVPPLRCDTGFAPGVAAQQSKATGVVTRVSRAPSDDATDCAVRVPSDSEEDYDQRPAAEPIQRSPRVPLSSKSPRAAQPQQEIMAAGFGLGIGSRPPAPTSSPTPPSGTADSVEQRRNRKVRRWGG